MTKSIEHDIFDFEAIPMGQSRHIGTDEYGFSTALRVPGGWIVRLHELRMEAMMSNVIQGIFVREPEKLILDYGILNAYYHF